jgi:hypothetical protein
MCFGIVLSVFAETNMKLSGRFEAQYGFLSSDGGSKYFSKYNYVRAMNSSGDIVVDVLDKSGSITYGAKIIASTTARNTRAGQSFIHITGDFGKFELGSGKSANAGLKVTGYSVSTATSGSWDIWATPDAVKTAKNAIPYATNFSNFLDTKTRTMGVVEYSRKITYYTPKKYGFQFGVSYILDTVNAGDLQLGNDTNSISSMHSPVFNPSYKIDIKDAIATGVRYEKEFNDTWFVKAGVVTEHGKACPYRNSDAAVSSDLKFKNLNTYTTGLEVTYKKFSAAASYANYLKSLTSNIDQYRDTHVYGVGIRYKPKDNLAFSVNYFFSNNWNNKISATTFAMDYKLFAGMMTYAEITMYSARGSNAITVSGNTYAPNRKTNGAVLILGSKMIF